jgi:large subunit ribosomal protein L24
MQKLKLNDEVVILAGSSKGTKGKILSINWKKNRVLVEGVNVKKKCVKPTQENPDGGIIDKECELHISNVAIVSPKDGKATRVKFELKDKKITRVAVKCGSKLN